MAFVLLQWLGPVLLGDQRTQKRCCLLPAAAISWSPFASACVVTVARNTAKWTDFRGTNAAAGVAAAIPVQAIAAGAVLAAAAVALFNGRLA